MIEKEKTLLVIFPGWGSFPNLYDKLNIKYDELLYFDEFEIEKFYYQLSKIKYDKLIVLAWSMGTLPAIKSLQKIKPHKLILLAPTLNFTETTSPLILKKMIRNMKKNKLLTIREFCKINFKNKELAVKYFEENVEEYDKIDVKYLIEGLEFLLNENISEIELKTDVEALIILASSDEVISNSNSKNAISCFNKSKIEVIACGHNIIYEGKIDNLVRSYLSD